MKRAFGWHAPFVAVTAVFVAACGKDQSATTATLSRADDPAAKIEQGRHIAEGVGMCHDCHTPRDEKGEPDMSRALTGSTLLFRPTIDTPWADVAPAVAGLPTMNDADAVVFFMTGERPGGVPPRPPMPRYRMSRDEAEAMVAYLRSLGTAG